MVQGFGMTALTSGNGDTKGRRDEIHHETSGRAFGFAGPEENWKGTRMPGLLNR